MRRVWFKFCLDVGGDGRVSVEWSGLAWFFAVFAFVPGNGIDSGSLKCFNFQVCLPYMIVLRSTYSLSYPTEVQMKISSSSQFLLAFLNDALHLSLLLFRDFISRGILTLTKFTQQLPSKLLNRPNRL